MVTMANTSGLDGISIPRRCGRQTARNNVESSSPEEYWRRVVFVPFMDHINKYQCVTAFVALYLCMYVCMYVYMYVCML